MIRNKSIVGAMFLIAGCCIGAGMLALPILSGMAGYIPSINLTILAWFFMTFTALLLLEANGWFSTQVNIVSIVEKALGVRGKAISWFLYLFLFYSLLVAYISVSGAIFSLFLENFFSLKISAHILASIFVAIFGFIVYLGTRKVDITNRIFMMGLIIVYLGMIFLGLFRIHPEYLMHSNSTYFFLPLPVLIISFGFHNMIPSLTAYFQGDLKKMRLSIILGSLLSLGIYILWQTVVIGIVPYGGENGIEQAFMQKQEATQSLQFYLKTSLIGIFAQVFSFFAIITSFLAQSLALMHFIADGMKVGVNKKNKIWLICATLVPPSLFALTYPEVFFKALNFAGGFCAVILFGIFPAILVWIGRYVKKYPTSYHVKGGKVSLILAIVFASFLALNELARIFGLVTFFQI